MAFSHIWHWPAGVTLATATTRERRLAPCRPRADSEVYYMAGRQLGALGRRLQAEGWPADTAVRVASRAGWPDALASTHALAELGHAVRSRRRLPAPHAIRPIGLGLGAFFAALAWLFAWMRRRRAATLHATAA